MKKLASFVFGKSCGVVPDIGLLMLRVSFGSMLMLGHGLGKLESFSAKSATFFNPLGLGSSTSMALAIFAEFFCSILVILGLTTRLALIPMMTTMAVAFLIVHAEDPYKRKELALVYFSVFLPLFIVGPGRFSLDGLIRRKLDKQPSGASQETE